MPTQVGIERRHPSATCDQDGNQNWIPDDSGMTLETCDRAVGVYGNTPSYQT